MNETTENKGIRRVLVALDSAAETETAIEAAAALAAELRAELLGLFIENAELLRLADLPFAAEIGYELPAYRRLDRETLKRALETQANRARRALAEAANRLRVQWSFQIARGQSVQLALDAGSECELLMLRLAGRSAQPASGLHCAAARTQSRPTMAVFDGTPSSERSLAIAATIAAADGSSLDVLVVARDALDQASTRERALQLLQSSPVKIWATGGSIHDARGLLKTVRKRRGKLLVMHRDSPLLSLEALAQMTDTLNCPLLLVK